jgi:hypothetical protein
VAERLPSALSAHEELSRTGGFTCEWENNFDEMYQSSREDQQRVREENPNEDHCEKLLVSNLACDAACPFNPRIGRKGELNETVSKNHELLNYAVKLHDDEKCKLLDSAQLQAWEVLALNLARENYEFARDRRLARFTAHEIMKGLSEAFGKKK